MPPDETDYTPSIDDNLLGLSTREAINIAEAEGLLRAELAILSVDEATRLSITLLLSVHKIAFGKIYEWAGKWRRIDVKVGQLNPPPFYQVPSLIYQFVDDLNYRMQHADTPEEIVRLAAWSHHTFVCIHPFTNGNGRTARLLSNLVLLLKQFYPVRLYHREGESRSQYINALRSADEGNFMALEQLIRQELHSLKE